MNHCDNLENILKKKINSVHQNIVFGKLEKKELENQLEYLITYKDSSINRSLVNENNFKNTVSYLQWKNDKLIQLQILYDNLINDNQDTIKMYNMLKLANEKLILENKNLKKKIENMEGNLVII